MKACRLALLGAMLLCTCTEPDVRSAPHLQETELPAGLQVSNPISHTGASLRGGAAILAAEIAEDFVYVTLPTGTVPGGVKAAVRRVGDEIPVTLPVIDGGFDAIAVRASPGDSIEIRVFTATGGDAYVAHSVVRPKRPPSVVRTYPPRKKSDMPLNASMVVVFSEPVKPSTTNSSTVKLFLGDDDVPGKVELLDGGTRVAFTPALPLEPQREYRLVISDEITDLDGDRMEADVVVGFTTGTSFVGPPASLSLSPDSVFVLAGSSYQFSALVFDAAGNLLVPPITWKTTTLDAISLSPSGLATGVQPTSIDRATWAPGTVEAIVGAESRSAYDSTSGLSRTAHVVVVPKPGSVEVIPSAAYLSVGDTLAFEVVTRATDAANDWIIRVPLTISNSDPAVASVAVPTLGAIQTSPLRTLKALTPGTTRVTIRAGSVSATLNVTVTTQMTAAAVRVAPAAAELKPQETLQLKAWMRDAEGRIIQGDRPTTWQSSNPSAVTVDATGRVTAVGNGSATISAASEGQSGSASIVVTAQPAGPRFVSLSSEFWQTCGVTVARDTYCWGGQFPTPDGVTHLRVPTILPGGTDLIDIQASGGLPGSLCGRTPAGEAFCWAYHTSIPTRFAPAQTFTDLSVSYGGHTCGITSSGTTVCWGVNTYGQLGDGTTQTQPGTPTPVAGGLSFKSVTTGTQHTCGLTTGGDAYCWGYNRRWLGDSQRLFVPGVLGTGDTTSEKLTTPTRVAGGHTFAQLSAGLHHTCGITTAGNAYCWGDNLSGTLGDGTVESRYTPVAVATPLRFTDISVGGSTTCAIAVGGAAHCWGLNFNGGLGVDGEARRQPVAVQGDISFVRLAAGVLHVCGIATTGQVYCWGDNSRGQLGDGSTASQRSMPMPIARPNP